MIALEGIIGALVVVGILLVAVFIAP